MYEAGIINKSSMPDNGKSADPEIAFIVAAPPDPADTSKNSPIFTLNFLRRLRAVKSINMQNTY
jgi:hypothetical protein